VAPTPVRQRLDPYCATKLMNIMFTTELARRTDGTGIVAGVLPPGPRKNAEP